MALASVVTQETQNLFNAKKALVSNSIKKLTNNLTSLDKYESEENHLKNNKDVGVICYTGSKKIKKEDIIADMYEVNKDLIDGILVANDIPNFKKKMHLFFSAKKSLKNDNGTLYLISFNL